MNKKKKINAILKRRAKKVSDRLKISNKPRYVSKAERAKLTEAVEAES